ncbi:MAG: hypothetical protein KDA99_09925, partial [Planctomycetales bacterium]|nr:hypothetical protein [Planctomycetales bacterium]
LEAAIGQQTDLQSRVNAASKQLTSHEYSLRYKFGEGEQLRYDVTHLATVRTRIQGNSQESNSRSKSLKVWKIEGAQSDGTATLSHRVDAVDMWAEVTGREPISYNSQRDKTPPAEYEHVAKTIGVPISTVTISRFGQVLNRDDEVSQVNFGTGGLIVPLPEQPVKLGAEWSVADSVNIEVDGVFKAIKTRQLYRLEKVETGVATISVTTQVLTPVDDQRIRSKLVQRLTQGEIRFDIDAGRVLSKRLDWDETVLGFDGPDSNMQYLARWTEELRAETVAQVPRR